MLSSYLRGTTLALAYDGATGERRLVERFNTADDHGDGAFGLKAAISPDGRRLFVGGTILKPDIANSDHTVVAYDIAS